MDEIEQSQRLSEIRTRLAALEIERRSLAEQLAALEREAVQPPAADDPFSGVTGHKEFISGTENRALPQSFRRTTRCVSPPLAESEDRQVRLCAGMFQRMEA